MEENRLREQQRKMEESQQEPAKTELDTSEASPSKTTELETSQATLPEKQDSSLHPSEAARADDGQCAITNENMAVDVGDGGPQTEDEEEDEEDMASALLRRGATEEAQALKGHDGNFDRHMRRALAWYRRGAQSQSTHGFSAAAAAQCTMVAQMLAGAFGGVGVDDEGAVLHYAVAAASGDINSLLAMGHRHAHGCERARLLEFEPLKPKSSVFQSVKMWRDTRGWLCSQPGVQWACGHVSSISDSIPQSWDARSVRKLTYLVGNPSVWRIERHLR
jgi:hypothetical protein